MVEFIKKYWFGGLLSLFSLVVLGVVCVVSIAPHSSKEMKGFSVCTYKMADELAVYGARKEISGVVQAIVESYVCYAEVMVDGLKLWVEGKQDTPWANYLFEVEENNEFEDEDVEPLSEDLLKANKLNDENGDIFDFSVKESVNE